MSHDRPTRESPFTRWQWAEIWALIVVIAAQVALHLVAGSLLATVLVGLLALALIIHCYSWLIPLWRKRRRKAGPS